MSTKTYVVSLGSRDGDAREVRVSSPTDVQAGDAARLLMRDGESILSIVELDGAVDAEDGPSPLTQAQELSPVTPGIAAVSQAGSKDNDSHG